MTVLRERGESMVFLDLSALPSDRIRSRFPRIQEILLGFGIDILREPPTPHAGAAKCPLHHRRVKTTSGPDEPPGLFARARVASTGLHGATAWPPTRSSRASSSDTDPGSRRLSMAKTVRIAEPPPWTIAPRDPSQGRQRWT